MTQILIPSVVLTISIVFMKILSAMAMSSARTHQTKERYVYSRCKAAENMDILYSSFVETGPMLVVYARKVLSSLGFWRSLAGNISG